MRGVLGAGPGARRGSFLGRPNRIFDSRSGSEVGMILHVMQLEGWQAVGAEFMFFIR